MINIKNIAIVLLILLVSILLYKSSLAPEQDSKNNTKGEKYSCLRKEPYKLEPELMRAWSLMEQRYSQNGEKPVGGGSWNNCINLVYKDLPEAEGLFFFDKNSSIQNLTIYVDSEYKSSDDLLTSVLLSHEFNHLGNFIHAINTGETRPCYESEAYAFNSQLEYLYRLSDEERNSITQKLYFLSQGQYRDNRMEFAVKSLKELNDVDKQAEKYCGKVKNEDEWVKCWGDKTLDLFLGYVKASPFYQKQCESQ